MKTRLHTLLLTLPAVFTLACGDAPEDAYDLDLAPGEPAAAAGDDLDFTAELHPTAALANQIAAHPAFATLSQHAFARVGDMLAVKSELTEAELEAAYSRLEQCRNVSSARCTEEIYLAGIDPVITSTEVALGQQLNNAFNLDGYTPTQLTLLLRDAQLAYGQDPGAALVPNTFEAGTVVCDSTCKSQVLAGIDQAHAGTLARMVSDDAGTPSAAHPWWIEIGISTGSLILGCLFDPGCYLWPFESRPAECVYDGDCPSDQYCWKGPLGIGENDCRDLKLVGDSCGRDHACKSDCCKFNLWDAGSTCRVASECD